MRLTPIKAIRLKCLDCSCDSSKEVKLCDIKRCPLYPYRLGKRPTKDRNPIESQMIENWRGYVPPYYIRNDDPPKGVYEADDAERGKAEYTYLDKKGGDED